MRAKPHLYKYACFHCRKAFAREPKLTLMELKIENADGTTRKLKTSAAELTGTCPECGGPIYLMGKHFKTPPRDKVKEWEQWEAQALQYYHQRLREAGDRSGEIDPYFSGHPNIR